MVVHGGFAGEVIADFPFLHRGREQEEWARPDHDGLGQALEWAARILAGDPAVHRVVIRRSVQEREGEPSTLGTVARIVTRDAPAVSPGKGTAPGPGRRQEKGSGLRPGQSRIGGASSGRRPGEHSKSR